MTIWIVAAAVVLLALVLIFVRPGKAGKSAEPKVCSGALVRFKDFKSEFIPPRTISVWLPEGYVTGDPVDVLYMHDGQMLFDSTTTWNHRAWDIDDVASALLKEGKLRPFIVVGIDNTPDRLNEYFPTAVKDYVAEEALDGVETSAFKGDKYMRFLVEELKPFVDSLYRPQTTPEHTFLMGSSMGGLISLYGLCEYPEVYGGAICMSSHLSFSHLAVGKDPDAWADAFRRLVDEKLPMDARLYMDYGTAGYDKDYEPYQKAMDELIQGKGFKNYMSIAAEGHDHNETFWNSRLDKPLLFMLGKEELKAD